MDLERIREIQRYPVRASTKMAKIMQELDTWSIEQVVDVLASPEYKDKLLAMVKQALFEAFVCEIGEKNLGEQGDGTGYPEQAQGDTEGT